MKKIIIISLVIFCLFVAEAILIYVCSLIESVLGSGGLMFRNDDFRFVTGIAFMRTVFYFVPQLIIFYFFLNRSLNKGLMGMSMLNVITFILISTMILGVWTNDLGEYIRRPVFYYFIFATALSPVLLNFIPAFKKLLTK